ncbi:unnamed protein product [Linum trigynum]|uniref:Transposase n=1 Tax=Linum trigynum TaxID=586398 RepID=A0AAV2E4Y6_9ROSI
MRFAETAQQIWFDLKKRFGMGSLARLFSIVDPHLFINKRKRVYLPSTQNFAASGMGFKQSLQHPSAPAVSTLVESRNGGVY